MESIEKNEKDKLLEQGYVCMLNKESELDWGGSWLIQINNKGC